MIIKVDEIRDGLRSIWPYLDEIWAFDQEYDCPVVEEVRDFMASYKIDLPRHVTDFCNYTALQFHARIAQAHHWAVGEAFGNKINGWHVLHNLNIAMCQGGVHLIDVRAGYIRPALAGKDNILFVRFT